MDTQRCRNQALDRESKSDTTYPIVAVIIFPRIFSPGYQVFDDSAHPRRPALKNLPAPQTLFGTD